MEIYGHRGWPGPATENTTGAVTAALAAGADGVEVDVRLTADGVAVLCHDPDLGRVSGGVGPQVATSTYEELREVPLLRGGAVPRLVEAAALTAGGAGLVLDLKPEPRREELIEAALAALGAAGCRADDVVLTSFDDGLLDVCAALAPGLARGAVLEPWHPVEPAVARALDRGDRALHVPLRRLLDDARAVEAAVLAGLEVRIWTLNRLVDARLAALLGVCGVISDVPDVLCAGRPARIAA